MRWRTPGTTLIPTLQSRSRNNRNYKSRSSPKRQPRMPTAFLSQSFSTASPPREVIPLKLESKCTLQNSKASGVTRVAAAQVISQNEEKRERRSGYLYCGDLADFWLLAHISSQLRRSQLTRRQGHSLRVIIVDSKQVLINHKFNGLTDMRDCSDGEWNSSSACSNSNLGYASSYLGYESFHLVYRSIYIEDRIFGLANGCLQASAPNWKSCQPKRKSCNLY